MITCCRDDWGLSTVLYSDNTLFAVKKFGNGLFETPPLHCEWSCPLVYAWKIQIKSNKNYELKSYL